MLYLNLRTIYEPMTLYGKSYHLNKNHERAISKFYCLKAGFYCI